MLEARATQLFRRPRAAAPACVSGGESATEIELDAASQADTPSSVRAACAAARGAATPVAAVTVRPRHAEIAARELAGTGVRVAAFLGLGRDPEAALAAGAAELEIVLDTGLLLAGRVAEVHENLMAFGRASGGASVKVAIDARELGSYAAVRRAADVALASGANFLKTAPDTDAAALPALALLLCEALRAHARRGGHACGLSLAGKLGRAPAGYREIVRDTLGAESLGPDRFRIAVPAGSA